MGFFVSSFTSWIPETYPKDLGNVISGVPGYDRVGGGQLEDPRLYFIAQMINFHPIIRWIINHHSQSSCRQPDFEILSSSNVTWNFKKRTFCCDFFALLNFSFGILPH